MFDNRGYLPPRAVGSKQYSANGRKQMVDLRRLTDQGGAPPDEEAALLEEIALENRRLEEVKLRSSLASMPRSSVQTSGSRHSSMQPSRRTTAESDQSKSKELSAGSKQQSDGADSEAGTGSDIDHGLQEAMCPVTPSSVQERSIGNY